MPFHLEGDFKLQPDDCRVVGLLVAVTLQDLLSGVVAVDVKAGWGKKLFLESPKQFLDDVKWFLTQTTSIFYNIGQRLSSPGVTQSNWLIGF